MKFIKFLVVGCALTSGSLFADSYDYTYGDQYYSADQSYYPQGSYYPGNYSQDYYQGSYFDQQYADRPYYPTYYNVSTYNNSSCPGGKCYQPQGANYGNQSYNNQSYNQGGSYNTNSRRSQNSFYNQASNINQNANTNSSIIDAIHEKLQNDSSLSSAARNIDVTERNGSVTLYGDVKDTAEKNRIEMLVRRVSGVKDISNHLTISSKR